MLFCPNATFAVILIIVFIFFQKTVSNSKRKRPRKSWSEENMARAINAINDKKMGWLKATKTFSVPHAALRREFNKIKDKDAASK
jgi:hypothetical protein